MPFRMVVASFESPEVVLVIATIRVANPRAWDSLWVISSVVL
jgi:hypothetical protein